MQSRKYRFITAGTLLLALSAGFFLFMLTMAPKSNDPTALMRTVGEVSGATGAIALVLIVLGVIRRTRNG